MSLIVLPILAGLALWLSEPPPPEDKVVLLPNADGSTGKVIVRSKAGELALDSAYASARADQRGALQATLLDAASVKARYADTLAAQPSRPESFILYFASGSADQLTPASIGTLNEIRTKLSERAAPEILVIGHTDRVGKLEANDILSAQRAGAVKKLLQDAGIAESAMEVSGRGEREPLIATVDEVAEERNRRVEINIR
jgi:outer membrane protein OmpA-like peptidoglycan-associated protein